MGARLLVLVSANAIAMGLMTVLVVITAFYGPPVETFLFPVVRIDAVDPRSIFRDEKLSCFSLPITKLRVATPVKYEFFIEARLSDFIPVAAYLADSRRHATNEDLLAHPVGAHWVRNYCFEIPSTIADKQNFRVTGEAIHDRHPFWNTMTPIVPFVVPALKKITDPDD